MLHAEGYAIVTSPVIQALFVCVPFLLPPGTPIPQKFCWCLKVNELQISWPPLLIPLHLVATMPCSAGVVDCMLQYMPHGSDGQWALEIVNIMVAAHSGAVYCSVRTATLEKRILWMRGWEGWPGYLRLVNNIFFFFFIFLKKINFPL